MQSRSGATKRRIYAMGAQKQHLYTSTTEPLWCAKRRIHMRGTQEQHFQRSTPEALWRRKMADPRARCSKEALSNISCRVALVPHEGGSTCGVLKSSVFKHLQYSHTGATNGRIYVWADHKQHCHTSTAEPLWCHKRGIYVRGAQKQHFYLLQSHSGTTKGRIYVMGI